MPSCYNYCGDTLGTHAQINCDTDLLSGGVQNVIILGCDHQLTDPSNGTAVQAEIDAGRAWKISQVRAELGEPAPIKQDRMVANRPQLVTGYDRTGTLMDENVSQNNIDFYNVLLSGGDYGGLILHLEDEGKVFWIDQVINFDGALVIPPDNTAIAHFNANFFYKTNAGGASPDIYDEPAGIF